MRCKKAFFARLLSLLLLSFSGLTNADMFLSSETKALIVKADAGDSDSQFRVGSAYDTGKGAPRDGVKAMKYYLLAAEQGHANGQNSVGSGLQAEKRYAEALPWYERAAAQGHPVALNNLAYLHDVGLGVQQNRAKGFELYSRSADLGWAEAMWNLANMYGSGQIGKTDMVMACVWTIRADRFKNQGNRQLTSQITRIMPYLKKTLSEEDFKACRLQGESWSPQQPEKK